MLSVRPGGLWGSGSGEPLTALRNHEIRLQRMVRPHARWNRATGSSILIDEETSVTVGAGMINSRS